MLTLKGVHSMTVGATTTDAVGAYSIPYPPAITVASLAKLDGGRVNWEIDASLGSAEAMRVSSGSIPAHGSTGASSAGKVTAPLNLRLSPAPACAARNSKSRCVVFNCSPLWVTDSTVNKNVIIGEVYAGGVTGYTVGNTVEFDYLQQASTTIGVASASNGINWSESGSASVTNTSSASFKSAALGPAWGHQMLGLFQFYNQHALFPNQPFPGFCTPENRIFPGPWTGQVSYGADVSGNAGDTAWNNAVLNGYIIFEPAGSTFTRSSGAGFKYSAGVNVGPISVSAETDFSSQVTYTWSFNQGSSFNLFSSDAPPAQATIVYSSINGSAG